MPLPYSYQQWVKSGRFLQTQDGEVFYVHKGSGPPVIMLHMFGGNSWWYSRVLDAFATHFTVYAMDWPGCAQSETPALPCDIPDFADMLARFMDGISIERAHLLAIGGGAMTAVHFSATRPSRVGKLVLEVLPHWTREQAKAVWLETFCPLVLDEQGRMKPVDQWWDFNRLFPGLSGQERAAAVRRKKADFQAHGAWWLVMLTVGQLRYDVNEYLPLVQAPTLLLNDHATNGSRVVGSGGYYRDAEPWQAEALKDRRLRIIPDCGVTAAFEHPDEYCKVVLDFLR